MLEAAAADEEHAGVSTRRAHQDLFEPRVRRFTPDRSNQRDRRSPASSSAKLVIVEDAAQGRGERGRIVGVATRSPFTSSCTTSGTPPTAVATTGVPTESDSTAACGRFSHALGSTAAAAPAR